MDYFLVRSLLPLAFFFLMLLPSGARADDPSPAGYVGQSTGEWRQNGHRIEPHTAAAILPGAVITLDPAYAKEHPNAALIIIYLVDGRRIERSWKDPDKLNEPIHIEPTIKEEGGVGRLLSATARLFRRAPERYEITMSRGTRPSRLQESVLALNVDQVDLAPALRETKAGRYTARLQSVGADSAGTSGPLLQQPIDWSPGHAAILKADGLRPGIWRLSIVSATDDAPLDGSAWVLLCAPDTFAQATATLSEAVRLCDSWGDPVKPQERRALLRETLDSIASSK